MTYLDRTLRRQ